MKTAVLMLAVVVVAAFAGLYTAAVIRSTPMEQAAFFDQRPTDHAPLVFAHQGGELLRPSNTMVAFSHAVELGADVLDTDMHVTADCHLVYKYEGERHFVQNDPDTEMALVELFVPGAWETEWADPSLACTWAPTGTNLEGTDPTRDIAAHTSDGTVHEDV